MALRATRDERDSIDLGSPRLYREDLEQMARIVRDECAGQVTIEFFDERDRIGDSPSSFAEHHAQEDTTEVLRRLAFSGQRDGTRITVSFLPSEAELSITNPDNGTRGAARQIEALCRTRRDTFALAEPLFARTFWSACLSSTVVTAFGGLLLVGAVGPETTFVHLEKYLPVLIALGLVGLLSGFLAGWRSARGPVLVNAPRADRPSWWQRHRKDVFLLLVGGCIGYGVNQIPALAQLLSGG